MEYTFDITEGTPFSDKEFEWGWCTETIEHIPQKIQKKFIKEACRVCKNIIFTFPSPNHPSFSDDPGHAEVTFRFDKLANKFDVYKKTTKTGRNIVILTDKKEKVDITKRGIKYKDKKFIGPLDKWLEK